MMNFYYFSKLGVAYNASEIEKFSVSVVRSTKSFFDSDAVSNGEIRVKEESSVTFYIDGYLKGAKKGQSINYATVSMPMGAMKSVAIEDSKLVSMLSEAGETDQLDELKGLIVRLEKSLEAKAKAARSPEVFSFDEKSQKNYAIRLSKIESIISELGDIEEDEAPVSIEELMSEDGAEDDENLYLISSLAESVLSSVLMGRSLENCFDSEGMDQTEDDLEQPEDCCSEMGCTQCGGDCFGHKENICEEGVELLSSEPVSYDTASEEPALDNGSVGSAA